MPEWDVLPPYDRVRAHDARKTADPLRDFRVALVRHRGGPLHSFPERLLDFAHLGAREVSDLGREPLQRGSCQSQSGEELRMAVARDHLRGERVRLQPEALARDALDFRLDLRVRADGPRELSDAVRPECAGDSAARAIQLERPTGELPAEGDGLGVDAVRAADADGVTVLFGALDDGRQCAVDAFEDE